MPKIATLDLRVTHPDAQRQFYREVLGMQPLEGGQVGYGGQQAGIRFLSADTAYRPAPQDLYWKIAFAVPNIELACKQLRGNGIDVGTPHQFQNVGYLAHFKDPEGFTIELIEHYFEGDRPAAPVNDERLGGGASLNLITLRTDDISSVEKQITKWGMTPLSVQPVESHGFTLHFFAFTSDKPPSTNLQAVENRTWLYQRPYTVLELQCLHQSDPIVQSLSTASGYAGIHIRDAGQVIGCDSLLIFSH